LAGQEKKGRKRPAGAQGTLHRNSSSVFETSPWVLALDKSPAMEHVDAPHAFTGQAIKPFRVHRKFHAERPSTATPNPLNA
jgi:hypothetical protein